MTLFVINPNSSQAVTDGIDAAIDPLRALGRNIICDTLHEGPPGIENQLQADLVIAPLMLRAQALMPQASGVVIACFGDPGLFSLRHALPVPVWGIQESAVMTALMQGQRFGVIAILPASIPRHLRAFGAMGVMDRLAGDRALGLGVADLADPDTCFARMTEIGTALRDRDGADVLILGCAGMAQYRKPLEAALGLPVIDPCQAAVSMALGHLALKEST
ncbi:MAG: aspartate/glutamate racemase family protein [Rhodobacteraceae bacterium]|nr:aspartate/glutamate racemase family protein [Paracoccaceae bacterium]